MSSYYRINPHSHVGGHARRFVGRTLSHDVKTYASEDPDTVHSETSFEITDMPPATVSLLAIGALFLLYFLMTNNTRV
jgi:hypothetical protein